MRDYNHWTMLGVLCELLPQAENRVTLADETDQYGMPVAHFSHTMCDNDKRNIAFATATMERIWEHAGAQDTLKIDRYAHLVGGARMGFAPRGQRRRRDHRVWGVPNLFVVDGSVLPTQGAANPALVIMALADRCAGLLRDKRVAPIRWLRWHDERRHVHLAADGHDERRRPISELSARAYTIPTDAPEVRRHARVGLDHARAGHREGGRRDGLGWTYGHQAIATADRHGRSPRQSTERDALDVPGGVDGDGAPRCATTGGPGLSSMAIAAVDVALWDLKAKLLDVPLAGCSGALSRRRCPIYGSGGFTSYSDAACAAAGGLGAEGIAMVKMKIGRDPVRQPQRVRAAREAIGPDVQLFVDANGAYRATSRRSRLAYRLAEHDVQLVRGAGLLGRPRRAAARSASTRPREWRSRPASTATTCPTSSGCWRPRPSTCCRPTSRAVRASPSCCASTRCAARAHARCRCTARPRSTPSPAPALETVVHIEYFHDHVRIEEMLFDGVPSRATARCQPTTSAPGWGWSSARPTPSATRPDPERYAA